MSLAKTNKEIRRELELLTKEVRVLSAIYWGSLQFISEDQKHQIKSEISKIISENSTQEEMISYYRRNSGRIGGTSLESEVLEIIKPLKKLSEQKIINKNHIEDFLKRGWRRLEELPDNKVIIEIKRCPDCGSSLTLIKEIRKRFAVEEFIKRSSIDEETRKTFEKQKFIDLSETQYRCEKCGDWIYNVLTDMWFRGSFI